MTDKQPQFRVIADYVEEGIRSRRFDPNRRLPSDMELARKFAASRPTVVRAMIELQNRGLIERRAGSGTYIRQQIKPVATEAGALGLIVAGLGNTEILDPICAEITRQCEQRGFVVFRGESASDDMDAADFSAPHADALVRRCVERNVRGVFFAPLELADDRTALNFRIAGALTVAGIAVVLIDREICDFPGRSSYDLVTVDSFTAAYELGYHLISTGRHRIRFAALPRYPSTTDQRIAGLREAIINLKAPYDPNFVHIGDPRDPQFVATLLAPEAPDAIVCSNDRTAAMLMQALTALGQRIPEEIAVAGFDDVRYATLLSVPLTTMRQPCREIGVTAFQLMMSRLTDAELPARMVTLQATLVARGSTGVG